MTGAYLRVQRDGKWQSIEVEHLTIEERKVIMGPRSSEELLRWLDMCCEKLHQLEPLLDGLERDGIIGRRD